MNYRHPKNLIPPLPRRSGQKHNYSGWLSLLSTIIFLLFLQQPSFAQSITPGTGLGLVTPQSTGIYALANLQGIRTSGQALALFHKGTLVEIHAKSSTGAYLTRTASNKAIKLSPATYNELLKMAGGINKNIETLSPDKREAFYRLAGLSQPQGGTTLPLILDPQNGTCPKGYQLKRTTTGFKCVVISSLPNSLLRDLAALWESATFIAEAEARLISFAFKLSNLFTDVIFQYESPEAAGLDVGAYVFKGFGFDIRWTDG